MKTRKSSARWVEVKGVVLLMVASAVSIVPFSAEAKARYSPVTDSQDGFAAWCGSQGGSYHAPGVSGPEGDLGCCDILDDPDTEANEEALICCEKTPFGGSCTQTHEGRPKHDDITALLRIDVLNGLKASQDIADVKNVLEGVKADVAAIRSQLGGLPGSCTTIDLLPLPHLPSRGLPGPELYCQRNDQGQLLIRVHNQGGSDAAASTTRVVFGCPDPTAGGCSVPVEVNLPTPALAGFTSGSLSPLDIPAGCFHPDTLRCEFTISADVDDGISESDEANNNVTAECGPQIF